MKLIAFNERSPKASVTVLRPVGAGRLKHWGRGCFMRCRGRFLSRQTAAGAKILTKTVCESAASLFTCWLTELMPAGMGLISSLPSLSIIKSFKVNSEAHRLAAGALEARIVEMDGFSSAEKFKAAYEKATADVEAAFQSRAEQIAEGVVQGQIDVQGLSAASNDMKRGEKDFAPLYGGNVSKPVSAVVDMARAAHSENAMQNAQAMASKLLDKKSLGASLQASPELMVSAQEGTAKKIPDAWKLQPAAHGDERTAHAGDARGVPAPQSKALDSTVTTLSSYKDETAALPDLLRSLKDGQAALDVVKTTPENREVSFFVQENGGSHRQNGRIKGVIRGSNGEPELVFSAQDYNDAYTKAAVNIPLSKIDLNSVSVTRVISQEQQEVTVAKFEEALRTGAAVSYIDQFGAPRQERGRIGSLEKDRSGKIASFVLAEDNGREVMSSIKRIDPSSIRLFNIQPRPLTGSESALVEQLKLAVKEKRYVSFRAKSPYGSGLALFEGWMTTVEVGTDGEYMFRANEDTHELGKGSHKYRLLDILTESFDPRPTLKAAGSGSQGLSAARLEGLIEFSRGGGVKPVSISNNLYSEMSVFADPNRASGSKLPEELERLILPGQEMRLYFSNGERRIRLTVRRSRLGEWSFGDTAFDRLTIDESYRNEYARGDEDPRYSTNERDRLVSEHFRGRLPAARLRDHLQSIRLSLLNEGMSEQFSAVYGQWAKVIPENVSGGEVQALLLHDQGQNYYLDRGFVSETTLPLSTRQAEILAAIHYLVEHDMVFWSYNAGSSGIKMGIYPRTGSGSVQPRTMWLAGYDFGNDLLKSMKNAGLQFIDGAWATTKN